MQTMIVQRRGQGAADLAQQLRVTFDRGYVTGDFLVAPQEAAGLYKLIGHKRSRGSKRDPV